MATSITHVVFAQKVFERFFSDKDKLEFFIGTLFPDIRHLGVIARERTHFHNLTIEEIQRKSSFMAGVMFHSLLDEVREAYITYPQSLN